MAARKAGPNLTADSFAEALETLEREPDFLGSPRFKFSKTDHLGSRHAPRADPQRPLGEHHRLYGLIPFETGDRARPPPRVPPKTIISAP